MKTIEKTITDATGQVVSEVELHYKTAVKSSDRVKITNSLDIYNVLKTVYDLNKVEHKEMFYAVYLNSANRVLGVILISEGGTSSTVVDPKTIFQAALKMNASGIIISHNHSSGQTIPSEQDNNITKKIKEGAKLLDMTILDHIIMGEVGTYYSYSDAALI